MELNNRGKSLINKVISEVSGFGSSNESVPDKAEVREVLLKMDGKKLGRVFNDFLDLYDMSVAAAKGKFKLSAATYSLLIGSIVYVVSPIDLLPEVILGPVGYFDDGILVSWLVENLGDDLNRFKRIGDSSEDSIAA